jgi:phasin family protein
MFETIQKMTNESQKASKETLEATLRSFAELNKGFQAITAQVTDYSKKAFEDGTRAFEQLIGAKSIEQAVEIQSDYAKNAYETWAAEVSKLREMYVALAKDAYKPVQQTAAKYSRKGSAVAAAE